MGPHRQATPSLSRWCFYCVSCSLLLILPGAAVHGLAGPPPAVLRVPRAEHNADLPAAEREALDRLRELVQRGAADGGPVPGEGANLSTNVSSELARFKKEIAESNYEKDPCTMTGVQCAEGHVSVVSLRKKGLAGEFPSALRALKATLTGLDLAHNSLRGTIPGWLGEFGALQKLNLGQNFLSGTLPASVWASLPVLDTLMLADNELEGDLPDELGLLSKLRMLGVAGNRFSGTIPASIGGLRSLQRVRWRNSKGRHLRHTPSTKQDNGGLICPTWTTGRLSVLKPGVDCREPHVDRHLAQEATRQEL